MRYLRFQARITKGFTLAEVLITLTIIGVIAALAIPALINSTQEAEYNVALTNFMSDLSAAVRMLQTNNGGSIAVGYGTSAVPCMAFRDDFCNVMQCTKDTEAKIFGGKTYEYYKAGDWYSFTNNISTAASLSNGNLLEFFSYGSGCVHNGVNACGYIVVDINGQKGPNMLGKDTYLIYIVQNNGLYSALPAGTSNDALKASTSCIVGDGRGCAYYRLTNPANIP